MNTNGKGSHSRVTNVKAFSDNFPASMGPKGAAAPPELSVELRELPFNAERCPDCGNLLQIIPVEEAVNPMATCIHCPTLGRKQPRFVLMPPARLEEEYPQPAPIAEEKPPFQPPIRSDASQADATNGGFDVA